MKARTWLSCVMAGIAWLALSDSAAAFTVTYDCSQSGGCASSSGVSGTADFSFAAYDSGSSNYSLPSDTTMVMSIKLTNTSGFVSRISGFALNFPAPPAAPDADHYDQGTTPFAYVHFNDGFSGNSGSTWGADFDVCVNDNQATCPGGGGSGIAKGQSATLYFGFIESMTAAEIESAFVAMFEGKCQSAMRFQGFTDPTNGATSDKVCGGLNEERPPVPEPGTLALLGIGLLGLGASRRRATC